MGQADPRSPFEVARHSARLLGMRKPQTPYPTYALSERIADGSMHAIGVIGASVGASYLIVWAAGNASGGQMVALAIYGAALIATFAASAFYHMTPWEGLRPRLRQIDHAAIYVKIAGTYTPLVVMIGSAFAYVILGIVWALAMFGVITKIFFWRRPGWFSTGLYLIMGWLSVALIWGLLPVVPTLALVLIAVGGGLYTSGVVFYQWEGLKFSIAIWHGFVVAASACFFAAITLGSMAQSIT